MNGATAAADGTPDPGAGTRVPGGGARVPGGGVRIPGGGPHGPGGGGASNSPDGGGAALGPASAGTCRAAATGRGSRLPAPDAASPPPAPDTGSALPVSIDAARLRLARAQNGLLAALVAGGPVPPGFDPERIRVQSRALAGKRGEVTAKVAPELPVILGKRFRPSFLAYALAHPNPGRARADAMAFAQHLLAPDDGTDRGRSGALTPGPYDALTAGQRDGLERWVRERSAPSGNSRAGPLPRTRPDGREGRSRPRRLNRLVRAVCSRLTIRGER